MHRLSGRLGLPVAMLLALDLCFAGPLGAGDPIPDIDITVEQIPGSIFTITVRPPFDTERIPVSDADVILQKIPSGLAFDGVRLSGDRAVRDLQLDELPTGWGLLRKGKKLDLSGPAVVPPIRFRLAAGAKRPIKLDIELLADGKVGHSWRGISPREVPERKVAGTIEGIVQLPPRVSPGETLALRTLPQASLPPGAWVISGTVSDPSSASSSAPSVSEPWTVEELRAAQRSKLNTTRSNIRLETAGAPLTLIGDGGCAGLALTAAALLARDNFNTSKSNTVELEAAPNGERLGVSRLPLVLGADPTVLAAPLPPAASSYHLLSKGKLGAGLRSSYTFALAQGDDPNLRTGFAITEEEMPVEPEPPPSEAESAIRKKDVRRVAVHNADTGLDTVSLSPEARSELTVRTVEAEVLAEVEEVVIVVSTLAAQPVAGGCRYEPREPTEVELLRMAKKPPRGRTTGKDIGKLAAGAAAIAHLVSLPSDLLPGDSLSIRYLDEWGDPWVEVDEVPDVDVVPAEEQPPRGLEGAGRYVVAGRSVCVCGGFDALDIATPFQLGGRTVQATSIGQKVAWLTVPADSLGPQVIQAGGLRGEAATDVIQVAAELDQENLFSGQQTPLRLTVQGSEQRIPLELVNRTPQIITVEGGDEQSLETPGGPENTIVRQLSAQQRGSFQLFWEVPPAPCPCADGPN